MRKINKKIKNVAKVNEEKYVEYSGISKIVNKMYPALETPAILYPGIDHLKEKYRNEYIKHYLAKYPDKKEEDVKFEKVTGWFSRKWIEDNLQEPAVTEYYICAMEMGEEFAYNNSHTKGRAAGFSQSFGHLQQNDICSEIMDGFIEGFNGLINNFSASGPKKKLSRAGLTSYCTRMALNTMNDLFKQPQTEPLPEPGPGTEDKPNKEVSDTSLHSYTIDDALTIDSALSCLDDKKQKLTFLVFLKTDKKKVKPYIENVFNKDDRFLYEKYNELLYKALKAENKVSLENYKKYRAKKDEFSKTIPYSSMDRYLKKMLAELHEKMFDSCPIR